MIKRAAAVELALWYHDAVYAPRAADNEERSAALAATELGPLVSHRVQSVTSLVLATGHQAIPASPDAQLLVDIDLAVLGSPVAEFDAYEARVAGSTAGCLARSSTASGARFSRASSIARRSTRRLTSAIASKSVPAPT